MGVDDGKSNVSQTGKKSRSSKTGTRENTLFWCRIILLAFTITFVAGGWVPKEDVLFTIFTSIYIEFMNRKIFPAATSSLIPGMFPGRIFFYYIISMSVLGMLVPFLYVTGAFFQGDMIAVKEAVPSLFLLLAQVQTENITWRKPRYSLMTRALVPFMYNTRRIFTLWSWTLFLFGDDVDPAFSTGIWFRFGQMLAVLQVIIWNYNLFGFLIPIFLPGTIRQYQEVEEALKS